jgi:hypothetical protein
MNTPDGFCFCTSGYHPGGTCSMADKVANKRHENYSILIASPHDPIDIRHLFEPNGDLPWIEELKAKWKKKLQTHNK